jgi:hypothetical protein
VTSVASKLQTRLIMLLLVAVPLAAVSIPPAAAHGPNPAAHNPPICFTRESGPAPPEHCLDYRCTSIFTSQYPPGHGPPSGSDPEPNIEDLNDCLVTLVCEVVHWVDQSIVDRRPYNWNPADPNYDPHGYHDCIHEGEPCMGANGVPGVKNVGIGNLTVEDCIPGDLFCEASPATGFPTTGPGWSATVGLKDECHDVSQCPPPTPGATACGDYRGRRRILP